jgi:hypothetical protein
MRFLRYASCIAGSIAIPCESKVYLLSGIYYRWLIVRAAFVGIVPVYQHGTGARCGVCSVPALLPDAEFYFYPAAGAHSLFPILTSPAQEFPNSVPFIKVPQKLVSFNPHLGYKINLSSNILQVEQILSCFPVF